MLSEADSAGEAGVLPDAGDDAGAGADFRDTLASELAAPDDARVPLETRARAYLHSNCAGCHRPDTALRPKFDLTAASNPLADPELCGVDPIAGDLGVTGAKRLVPGDPAHSLILLRMQRRDANAMPPLGSTVAEDAGVQLVSDWIASLGPCE